MKLLLIASVSLGAFALSASAQSYSHYRVGNYDYWSGPGGYSGTGYRVGNYYYYQDNYGSGTGYRVGNYDYYDYTPNGRYGW